MAGSISPTRVKAAGSSSGRSRTNPVTPSTTTSGTAPPRSATTGVPQAIASIITIPNGSSHCTGNSRQRAPASSRRLAVASATPYTWSRSVSRGRTSRSK